METKPSSRDIARLQLVTFAASRGSFLPFSGEDLPVHVGRSDDGPYAGRELVISGIIVYEKPSRWHDAIMVRLGPLGRLQTGWDDLTEEEQDAVFRFLDERYSFRHVLPDAEDELLALQKVYFPNASFIARYGALTEDDFASIDILRETFRDARKESSLRPLPGDTVIGTYRGQEFRGMVDSPRDPSGKAALTVCVSGGFPHVSLSKERGEGYYLSTSGGPFLDVPSGEFEHLSEGERQFWFFGHAGMVENGGVAFSAPVNVWRLRNAI